MSSTTTTTSLKVSCSLFVSIISSSGVEGGELEVIDVGDCGGV